MSKYISKMKDGSEQHVMPAVHNTLKEALLTLSHYITGVVEDMDDDSMEDPFNYAIEEVDGQYNGGRVCRCRWYDIFYGRSLRHRRSRGQM